MIGSKIKYNNGGDLNSLLIIANFFVCILAMIFFYSKGENIYVNIYSLIIIFIFGAQNFLILLYERFKRDPFVIILMTITVAFYMGRVVTLIYDPWSSTLMLDPHPVDSINYSLIYILCCNASVFLGLSSAKGKIYFNNKYNDEYSSKFVNVIIILILSFVVAFYIQALEGAIGRFAGFISNFFIKLHLILLFTFVYLAISYNKLVLIKRLLLFFLITLFVILRTLNGSRSAILLLAYMALIGILSVNGRIFFNKKKIFVACIIIPFSVIAFTSATYIRKMGANRQFVSEKQILLLKESNLLKYSDRYRFLFRPIFDRIGFLDYSTILISNPEKFRKIINFRYYFKSIVDNVLSPGFNVFGTPRVSHSMKYIARGESVPSYKEIAGAYQSNMPTIYGEYYVLFFGYPSLFFIFIFSYMFKKIYLAIRVEDPFLMYAYRALILYYFYLWLNSFGIDWRMLDLFGIFMTTILLKNFYRMYNRKDKYFDRAERQLFQG